MFARKPTPERGELAMLQPFEEEWPAFRELHGLMNRLMGRFGAEELPPALPKADFGAYETDQEVVVWAEVPGFEPAELTVELRGDRVMIRGEHKMAPETGREGGYSTRTLHETVRLPAEVDGSKAAAVCRHGVLEIRMPKLAPVPTQKIEVRAG